MRVWLSAMAVSAAAIDLIAGQLNRNEYGVSALPKLVLIPGTWVAGPTVRQQQR